MVDLKSALNQYMHYYDFTLTATTNTPIEVDVGQEVTIVVDSITGTSNVMVAGNSNVYAQITAAGTYTFTAESSGKVRFYVYSNTTITGRLWIKSRIDDINDETETLGESILSIYDAVDYRFTGKMPDAINGYLDANGGIHPGGDDNNQLIVLKNALGLGGKYSYSGGYSSAPTRGLVWWFDADGVGTNVLSHSTNPYGKKTNYIIDIPETAVEIRAWSSAAVQPLAFAYLSTINSNIYRQIIVDANGRGDYRDIQSAIDYAKANFDVANVPVTIFIKNGVYSVSPTSEYPFYAIDKGGNKISLIGESRDGTIIRCICTSTLQGIALNVGGECTIANMTIENLADASYTSETILDGNHRPYCIHNDVTGSDETAKYYTTITNVKCYSECDTPIGAGMHHNQVQRYERVECVYAENAVIKQQGALYIHAPVSGSAVSLGLEVIDCVLISENERPAISVMGAGTQPWAEIPQTYIRNLTYGGAAPAISGPAGKTKWCALNSSTGLNYNQ